MSTKIKDTLGYNRMFCLYKMIHKDGRKTKMPVTPYGKPLSVTKPEQRLVYAEAEDIYLKDPINFSGIGIIFDESMQYVGIDMDNVIDNNGFIHDDVKNFIYNANTYTEISPSGKGLHVYMMLDKAYYLDVNRYNPKDKPYSLEIYNHSRFFTVTNNPYYGYDTSIKLYDTDTFTNLLQELGYPWNISNTVSGVSSTVSPAKPTGLSDDEIIAKINNVTNTITGKAMIKYQMLFQGNKDYIERNYPSYSEADMALVSKLAYFSGDREQVDRLWLKSGLGEREKTKTRKSYRKDTINKAFASKHNFYNPTKEAKKKRIADEMVSKVDPEELKELKEIKENHCQSYFDDNKKRYKVVPNLNTVYNILKRLTKYEGAFSYDEFSGIPFYHGERVDDFLSLEILSHLQAIDPDLARLNKTTVQDAIDFLARDITFHPIKDYLYSTYWDGEERLPYWIDQVLGVPNTDYPEFTEYRSKVGENFIKALVARIFNPGCKFDYAVVIEGEQGTGKSTLLAAIAGYDYLLETSTDLGDKDFLVQTKGKWLVELAEGEAMSKTNIQEMKMMLSRQNDTYREPYGRNSITAPRQFIMCMTTNDKKFLKDETGNRRFLPLSVYRDFVDLNWFQENKHQLFAEAVYKYLEDPSFDVPVAESRNQQAKRHVRDVLKEAVEDFLADCTYEELHEGYTIEYIWKQMPFSDKNINKQQQMELSQVLAEQGLEKARKYDVIRKKQVRKWYLPASSNEELIENLNKFIA